MIAIIDYGMGNLRSVQKALEKVGAKALITHDAFTIEKSEKIVLPGVGAMKPAMEQLQDLKLIEPIKRVIEKGKPFLGICLGLQLLFEESDEGGRVNGIGILKGSVKKFTQGKVPHMGWNQVNIKNKNARIFEGTKEASDVYFCHSYYVQPQENKIIASMTEYGINFVSAVASNNVFGLQFHPEKSQKVGLQVLKNFVMMK